MVARMLMLGDMYNHSLKGHVDALCHEIAEILANQPGLLESGNFQSQSQGGGGLRAQTTSGTYVASSLVVPDPADYWWPKELGAPSAIGAQKAELLRRL